MARNTQMSRDAGRTPAAANVLATLETRTTSEAAQAAPKAGLHTGRSTNFSGQYLYDRFVSNDKTEVTKLGIVRQMVDQLDVDEFKKVINDFVAVAAGFRDNRITAEKEAGTYDKDKPSAVLADILAKYKTAQNHQTVMRLAYGALKFAPDELAANGYTENTGYQTMRVIASNALKAAGLKWDGTKLLAKTDQERKQKAKAESAALDKVMVANPRNPEETMPEYLSRVSGMVDEQVKADAKEHEDKLIEKIAKQVRASAGGLLDEVIQYLMTHPAGTLDPEAAKEAAKTAVKH